MSNWPTHFFTIDHREHHKHVIVLCRSWSSGVRETAEVFKIVQNWFNVVNVRSRYEGQRTRDPHRNPITKENRQFSKKFLTKFLAWVEPKIGPLACLALQSCQTFVRTKKGTTIAEDGLPLQI